MNMGQLDDDYVGVDYIRFFNTANYTFRFRAETYEVSPIYNAINDLLVKVNNELSKTPFG